MSSGFSSFSRSSELSKSWRRDGGVYMFVLDYGINIVTGNYNFFISLDLTATGHHTSDWFWTWRGGPRVEGGRDTHNQDQGSEVVWPESGQTRVGGICG